MRFRAERHGSVSQGYFPIEETSEIHPDLVEGWVWCRRAFDVPDERGAPFRAEDYWPRAKYERQFRRLVLAHEPLFKPIAQAMFQGLGCDPHLYDRKLTGTNFGLRLNYYPPMTAEQDRSGAGRLLGHEDVDLFTILPATRTDGLQVWNHRSGKWVRLRAPEGSIIINTGDYMQRISNDRLPSTTHRVGKPTRRFASDQREGLIPDAMSICGKTRSWKCCPASARRNTSRSRRLPSTREAPANSTATNMPSRRRCENRGRRPQLHPQARGRQGGAGDRR